MRDHDDLPLVQVAYVGDPPFKVLSATRRPKGLDDVDCCSIVDDERVDDDLRRSLGTDFCQKLHCLMNIAS